MDVPTTPPTADCTSPDAARVAALHRENEARAKALDADRRGDHHAATRHRADARQAVADRLDLPDPLPDEVDRRLERLADRATLCREMERHFRGLGDHATADGWMADAAAAEADAHRLRDGVAEFVRKGLRWLAEADPAAVLTLLGFADHGKRLAAVEAAVVELADGRGRRP